MTLYDRDKCKVYTHNGGKTLVIAPTALGALGILQDNYGMEGYRNVRNVRRYKGPFKLMFQGASCKRVCTVDEMQFVSNVATYGGGIVYDDA
jgi:hypothetical protein